MQYLIRTLTDSTGREFKEVIKARENERFDVVDAESKEKALKMVKKPKGLLSVVPSSFNNGTISRALKAGMYREDSERICTSVKHKH